MYWPTFTLEDKIGENHRIRPTRDFRIDSEPTLVFPNHVPEDFVEEREARIEAHKQRIQRNMSGKR